MNRPPAAAARSDTATSGIDSAATGARIPSAMRLLAEWVAAGECLGGQLFVWRDGAVLADAAVGSSEPGRAASAADVARYYCAVKPLTACCLARAADAGECDLDAPAGRYLPGFDPHDRAAVSLRTLLNHSSGMPDSMSSPYKVDFRAMAARASSTQLPAMYWYRDGRYNDFVSWCLLAVAVERITGEEFGTAVRTMLDDTRDRPDIRMAHPEPDRFTRCHQLVGGQFEAVPDAADDVLFGTVNPAHGGFGSARDLGLFYAELVRCLTGSGTMLSRERSRELTRPDTTVEFGPGLGRLRYGLGFTVDADRDALGTGWGPATFGHGGFVSRYRVVHGFADPDLRTAVAIRLFSVGARNNWRMSRLGSALRTDLGST